MKRFFNLSLSARLLIIFIVTAIAAVILLASLFTRGLGSQWQRAISPHLSQYVSYIRDDIGIPPNEARARNLAGRLPIEIQAHQNNELLFTTRNAPLDIGELKFSVRGRFREDQRKRKSHADTSGHTVAFNEDNNRPVLRLRQGDYSIYVEMGTPRGRGRGLDELIYAITGLALLLGLCYWLIRRSLAPIGRLQTTVQAISGGDLSVRTSESGSNDLAQLANSVDTMAERIQKMLDAKRELLLAISHELRSPLTRARVAADLVNESSFQQKIIQNIDEMELLIGQLVESERLQEHSILNCKPLELNSLISDVVESLNSNINWVPNSQPILVEADETRLSLLIRNLCINALTHGKHDAAEQAEVAIDLKVTDASIIIEVNDAGPGIRADHLESITDAFYRPDVSRTRGTGGFGLGLYLCLRIAEAHGGTLKIESPGNQGAGTKAIVDLPTSIKR